MSFIGLQTISPASNIVLFDNVALGNPLLGIAANVSNNLINRKYTNKHLKKLMSGRQSSRTIGQLGS